MVVAMLLQVLKPWKVFTKSRKELLRLSHLNNWLTALEDGIEIMHAMVVSCLTASTILNPTR